jgi:phage FluMu gp28-like protein
VSLTLDDWQRARRDPAVFADLLIGQPLWPHQEEVVQSTARYRVICAGRRAGKTRVFGTLALHQGMAVAGSKVLIVSANDRSSKRMLADIAGMARAAELLKTSVDDESTSRMVLTNGSEIECVPASMGAVRSAEADLLIVDEAGFVDQSIWEAAEPVVISRPGSKVLICSTPWGDVDHFFRQLWTRGMDSPDEHIRSWHWPSTVSPMVDAALLEDIREARSREYFEREYEAIWGDASGAYFTTAEVAAAVEEQPHVVDGAGLGLVPAFGGIDWGQARDASALALLTIDDKASRARPDGRPVFRVSLLIERYRTPYHEFIDEVVAAVRGFKMQTLAAETNGVGQMPTEELRRALTVAGVPAWVTPLTTTATSKAEGFGRMRLLLQQGRLILPNHPGLLKQLRALRFEQMPTGGVRISVPDSVGHDDLAMALCMALLEAPDARSSAQPAWDGHDVDPDGRPPSDPFAPSDIDFLTAPL